MIEKRPDDVRNGRVYYVDYALLALISAIFFAWLSAREDVIGNLSDGAVYLVMSDLFSPWYDAPHALGLSLLRDFSFPPLYPWVLAMLGGSSSDIAASYFATALMLSAMIVAVYAWFRSVMDGRLTALLLVLVFALLPATLMTALGTESEPLYIALTYAGLACTGKGSNAGRNRLTAFLFALCVLARTVGISIVAGALVYWWVRCSRREWFALGGLMLGPPLCWHLFRSFVGAESSYVDGFLGAGVRATAAQMFEYAAGNLASLPLALCSSFDLQMSPQSCAVLAGLSVFAAITWITRLRRLELDALYVLFYLCVIIVWPYPQFLRRFLLVIAPLYLFYMFAGAGYVTARFRRGVLVKFVSTCYFVLLALLVAPSALGIVMQIHAADQSPVRSFARSPQWHSYADPQNATQAMRGTARILESLRGIDENLPGDACVSSAVSAYVLLYGRRAARPLVQSWSTDDQFFDALEQCPYVFLIAATQWPDSGYPALYPYERIKDRLEVIEVKLWERGASRGDVLTMLGYVPPRSR